MKHGEAIKDGAGRWCEVHKHEHGPLYPCDTYDEATLLEIHESNARWVAKLQDPEWVRAQIENGVPPIAIACYRAFAGLEPEAADEK